MRPATTRKGQMADGDTIAIARPRGLPVPYRGRAITLSRQRLPSPRLLTHVVATLDRAPLNAALSAYAEGETRDVRRLPAGFFRSRTV